MIFFSSSRSWQQKAPSIERVRWKCMQLLTQVHGGMRGLKRRRQKAAAAGEDGWSSTQMSWQRRVSIKRFGWRTFLALPYGHVLHWWMNKEKYPHLTSLWLCIGESNPLNTENYTTFQKRHQSLSSINVKWGESFFIVLIRLFFPTFFPLKWLYANNQDWQSKIDLHVFFFSFSFLPLFQACILKKMWSHYTPRTAFKIPLHQAKARVT